MFDSHTHSNFSGDSEMCAEAACEAAIMQGLKGIAFTDHLDYDFPEFDEAFLIDFDKYSKFMDDLISKYKNKLTVLKGIEVGIQPHVIEDTAKTVEKYDFDFVIASVHIIDRLDPYRGAFYEGKTREQAFIRYLEEILYCVSAYENYDVVGHIGYIRRYGNLDDRTLTHSEFSDVIDSILKKVIHDGKGIEINTSGYRSLGTPIPDYDIVKRYKELGGEIITIGSDAHASEHIGYNFDLVKANLLELGFKYTTHFERRKPVFDKIEK
ncbi:MAG: histidinol-phosphatase HisJ family protein [Clostridia bacterium]|nr:histidinol-phosphatase HisJ family protein [Clostridia bacterium]